MCLALGSTWAYMTPDYIYSNMTWAEVTDALKYFDMYIETGYVRHRKYRSVKDFIFDSDARSKKALMEIAERHRKGV